MRLGGFCFDPPLWGWMIAIPALALLLWLGTWQLQRGSAKEAMLAERAAARQAEAHPLPTTDAGAVRGEPVSVSGHYVGARQLLLDNQVWRQRVGYRVWTPLRTETGRLVLVDRGWIPIGDDRDRPPSPEIPEGTVSVRGIWRALPEPGLRLAAPGVCEQERWPRVLNYPTFEQVQCQFHAPVADGLLLLDEKAPGGFARDWSDAGIPPVRHYGYAVQWYALALAVAVLFGILNTRRDDASND